MGKTLSINDIMTIVHKYIVFYDIQDEDLRVELYNSCIDLRDKKSVVIALNEVYTKYKKRKDYLYIDELRHYGKDIAIEYDFDLLELRMYICELLKILSPYERTIIVLEFYSNLSLRDISIKVGDKLEKVTSTERIALDKLKEEAGDLIVYLRTN